jgi:hypothetical protein
VLDLILYGAVIALEPLPIIGFILVLSSDLGTRNGAAFIAAWLVSLLAIVVVTFTLTGGKPVKPQTAPTVAVGAVNIAVGLLLLAIAVHRYRNQGPVPHPQPKWAERLDDMHAPGAALIGFLLQPWGLIAAAAASMAQATLSSALTIVVVILFTILATSVLAAMEIYSIRNAEAARQRLDGLQAWLDRNRDPGIIILATVAGLWLVSKGLYTLISQT